MFNTPDTVNGCFKFLNDTIDGVGGIFNMLVLFFYDFLCLNHRMNNFLRIEGKVRYDFFNITTGFVGLFRQSLNL